MNELERYLLDHINKTDTCWLWTGSTDGPGYGKFYRGGYLKAHRVAFELWRGPIPEGMLVCHTCDVRTCCNPAHLFTGTHLDNAQDRKAKGRNGPAMRQKLTDEQVRAIRLDPRSNPVIAQEYDVSRQAIMYIKSGRRRSDVSSGEAMSPSPGVG